MLTEALITGGIHHIPQAEPKDLMRAIVNTMPIARAQDRAKLTEILITRDALRSTVGYGIAIPHVHSAIVVEQLKMAITLCYLEASIDLGAADGRPIDVLFMLSSPSAETHLQLLSRLARALHHPTFRARVLNQANALDIFETARKLDIEEPGRR